MIGCFDYPLLFVHRYPSSSCDDSRACVVCDWRELHDAIDRRSGDRIFNAGWGNLEGAAYFEEVDWVLEKQWRAGGKQEQVFEEGSTRSAERLW